MSGHIETVDDGISKVVAFPGHHLSDEIPQSPFEIATSDKRPCRHHLRIRLDLHQREVSCADCYAVLDPFDYLVSNATVVQRACANYAFVQTKVGEQQERLMGLDKETKRLRAQVARLEAKAEQLKRGDAQVLSMPATGKTASTATAATKAPAPVSTAEGETPPRFVTIDLGATTEGRL